MGTVHACAVKKNNINNIKVSSKKKRPKSDSLLQS